MTWNPRRLTPWGLVSLPRLLPLALLACLLLAPSAASAQDPPVQDSPARPAVSDFTLKTLDGQPIRLSELRGKVVVITLWATWCAPCLQELPFLDADEKALGQDGLVVLAIATDGPETASDVRRIVRRGRWSMKVLHDTEGRISGVLNPRGTNPFTLFIDRQGRLAASHEGYNPGDEVRNRALIEQLLREKAP